MPFVPPVYTDSLFRQQFPAFTDTTKYPEEALQFAWNMGANWMSQQPQCTSAGLSNTQLQQAADLMGAVIMVQLYGPAVTVQGVTSQTTSPQGEAPGAVESFSEGSINASFQLPAIGSSAFMSMCLASPPYGRMLLALLGVAFGPGPYIPSGRMAWVPP